MMKACPNTLLKYYFFNVIKPKIILLNNGSQFSSLVWLRKQKESNVTTRLLPIGHLGYNSVRVMWELSEFFRIYCHDNHTKVGKLFPHIEEWLNKTVKKDYSSTQLMFREEKHSIFDKMFPELKHDALDI
jgi:hypothetical protein